MTFKPSLFPNEEVLIEDISLPIIASYKLDGIRCIFKNGEMISRRLIQIPNKQLHKRFHHLKEMSKLHNLILDGEIYSHKLTFQEITHYVMTQDMESLASIRKNGKIDLPPSHLIFHCFDIVENENFTMPFKERDQLYMKYNIGNLSHVLRIDQCCVMNLNKLTSMFNEALSKNYEGLIMRGINSIYKCGRYTVKSGDGYKLKKFRTFDAQIIAVEQATVVNPEAEKTINELGHSVTSKKKDDRILVEKASAFRVRYKEYEVKPMLALTDIQKETIWQKRDKCIGKWIEYKGMMVGAKDVPRHPVFIRFRKDKE